MKSKNRAAWAAAAVAITAALLAPMLAQTAPTSAPASADLPSLPPMAATPAPMDLSKITPEQAKSYLTTFGWVVAQQVGEKHFGLTNEDIDSLAAGMKLALTTGDNPTDIPGGMDGYNLAKEYFQARAEKVHDEDLAKQTAAGNKMFADLDKNPNVKKTPSGLYYEIIKPGTDPKPKTTDV
ncbi:MAG TPA: FKBP-type peptidyl-prolyl cis-trans isomerase N-terminal domain-containing protein, partial [Opitutales bacterium]|nr:FKBP-type peptidyl-prolyl cis-trans isomerase N-terminal domain-containing protein [Opitutales bacterium]